MESTRIESRFGFHRAPVQRQITPGTGTVTSARPEIVAVPLPATTASGTPQIGECVTWETDRREVLSAIAMVADGFARAVILCGLHDPRSAVTELRHAATASGTSLRLVPTADGADLEVRRL